LDIDEDGFLKLNDLEKLLTPKTKLVAVTWVSNVLGTINPVREITKTAHANGALVLVDGAQRAPHMPIDVQKEGFDFLAFTGHIMLAPMGIGVLWAREELLEGMAPFLFGGEMMREATLEETIFNELPWKFEAGTPNVGGAIGLGAAVDYLSKIGMGNVRMYGERLTAYGLKQLGQIEGLEIYGSLDAKDRGSLITFTVKGIHPHDLATALDQEGIAIRSGHHCAMPLHNRLGLSATARASPHLYNTKEEVDRLVQGIKEAKRLFGR
jgi:cysteine desulfurase/selenocysteine lyase